MSPGRWLPCCWDRIGQCWVTSWFPSALTNACVCDGSVISPKAQPTPQLSTIILKCVNWHSNSIRVDQSWRKIKCDKKAGTLQTSSSSSLQIYCLHFPLVIFVCWNRQELRLVYFFKKPLWGGLTSHVQCTGQVNNLLRNTSEWLR